MTEAESMAQIVAHVGKRDVTRGELSKAFDRVADKSNWKKPIDATVNLTDSEREIVAKAVTFFTGNVAKFEKVRAKGSQPFAGYRVTAPGYYRMIGA